MSMRNSTGMRRKSVFRSSGLFDPRRSLTIRNDRSRSLAGPGATPPIVSKQKSGILLYHVGGFLGGWKKKFVSLNNQFMEIFDDEKDHRSRNHIRLAHAILVHPTIHADKRFKKGVTFEIYEQDLVHILCSESDEQGLEWISIIRECIEDARLLLCLSHNISTANMQKQGYMLVSKVEHNYTGNSLQVSPSIIWVELGQEISFYLEIPEGSDQGSNKPVEIIDLSRANMMTHEKTDQGSFVIIITTPKTKYLFRTSSSSSFQRWTESIKRAIYQVKRLLEGVGYYEGWLVKHEKGTWKSSKPGYHIIQDGFINRYPDERSISVERSICLFNCSVQVATTGEIKHGFELKIAGKKIYFETTTAPEAQKWVDALETGIRRARDTKGHIVKQGYLFKDPQSVLSKPKYRWFVLRSGILTYYARDSDKTPIGSFETSDISVSIPSTPTKEKFGFHLKTNKGVYLMSASSREELQAWVKALQQVTRRNKGSRDDGQGRDRSLSCPPRIDSSKNDRRMTGNFSAVCGPNGSLSEMLRMSDPSSQSDTVSVSTNDQSAPSVTSTKVSHFDYDEEFSGRRQSLPYHLDNLAINPSLDSAVIIDTGSTFIRAGYSGDDFPTVVFPACLEYTEQFTANGIKPGSGLLGPAEMENSYYQLRGKVGPYHPKKNMDVDDMERIWEHMYGNELRVVSEDYGAVMVEPIGISNRSKERMYEIFFETFKVPYATMKPPSVLSLMAQGKLTGIGVTWGNRLEVSAIANGYMLPFGSNTRTSGGGDITELMMVLLNRTAGPTKKYTIADARWLKEKYGYVAYNFHEEIVESGEGRHMERNVLFPVPGKDISVCSERFICPEAMFDPGLLQTEDSGIHEIVYDIITKCDIDLRRDLLSNIVVSGGNTLFRGFPERLALEIENLGMKIHKTKVNCVIDAPHNRKYLPFIGASKYKSLPGFEENCYFLNDYMEWGSSLFQS